MIFIACDERPRLAKLLVDQANLLKIDLNQQDAVGRSALIIGCQNGEINLVRTLLIKKVDPTLYTFEDHNSALHWGCFGGHKDIIKLLLQFCKAQCDFKNATGQTGSDILRRNADTAQWANELFELFQKTETAHCSMNNGQ